MTRNVIQLPRFDEEETRGGGFDEDDELYGDVRDSLMGGGKRRGGKGSVPEEKKIKRCQILAVEIRKRSEDLADAIRTLCLEGILYPTRNDEGLTFIYPSNEVIDEITRETFDGDSFRAVVLVRGLVLGRAFRSAADFETHKEDIVSKKGIKYTLDKATKDKVTISGMVLSKDKFEYDKEVKIVIWNMESGKVPEDGEKIERRPPREKKGGVKKEKTVREKMVKNYLLAYSDKVKGKDLDRVHPLMVGAVSLCNYLKTFENETYQKVLPLLDADPRTSFFLLMGEPVITTEMLAGTGKENDADHVRFGWGGLAIYRDAQSEWSEHLKAAAEKRPTLNGVSVSFEEAAKEVKKHLAGKSEKDSAKAARAMYDDFAEKGSFRVPGGELSPLPRASWEALYRNRGGSKKALEDQMRYLLPLILDDSKGGNDVDDVIEELLEEEEKLLDKEQKGHDLLVVNDSVQIRGGTSGVLASWLRSPNVMYAGPSPFADYNAEKMKKAEKLMKGNHQPPLVVRYMDALGKGPVAPSRSSAFEEDKKVSDTLEWDDDDDGIAIPSFGNKIGSLHTGGDIEFDI